MRFHNNNSFVAEGDLDARMNCDEGTFGVIDLGHSDICLDAVEDARRLMAAAAKIVAWFETEPVPHAFESSTGFAFGPCLRCGHIKSGKLHAEPAKAESDKPLVISDSTIEQAKYFAQPGNTVADMLAEQAAS